MSWSMSSQTSKSNLSAYLLADPRSVSMTATLPPNHFAIDSDVYVLPDQAGAKIASLNLLFALDAFTNAMVESIRN